MKIYGEGICLVPSSFEDRETIYEWMADSNITPCLFSDGNVPTWQEFLDDYVEYYFDGSAPEKGRGFIIYHNDRPVGFISYSAFHLVDNKAELDIWMKSDENCGKGIGSSALRVLCEYLKRTLGMNEFVIIPSIKNPRAIRAYEKAGFVRVDMEKKAEIFRNYLREDFLKVEHDYDNIYVDHDNLLMIKNL
jgi:diamine N-acetyltransferase